MTGECKKLANPVAIMRKRARTDGGDVEMGDVKDDDDEQENGGGEEELEIVEVVRYKIVFSSRPEPISGVAEAE